MTRIPEWTKANQFLCKKAARLDPDSWAIAADFAEESGDPAAPKLRSQAELFRTTLAVIGKCMDNPGSSCHCLTERGPVRGKRAAKILMLIVPSPHGGTAGMRMHLDLRTIDRRPEYIRLRIVNEVL